VSRPGGAGRERRVHLGLVGGLTVLALMVTGCRSLRVELSATGPTPAAAGADRLAAPPGAPPVEAAPPAPIVASTAPDPTRAPTAAPAGTNTPVPTPTPAPAAPTPTQMATALPTAMLAATAVPELAADSFAPQGVTQTVSGAINATGQKDRYRFDAVQGQLLEARVKRTSGISLQPSLELIDPTGHSEATTLIASEESTLARRLASSGSYTLVVSGSGQGPYVATWWLDRFGQLVSGGEVSAEIAERTQVDRYHFQARQGQVVDVRIKRTSGISLQPGLDLYDPMGTREAYAITSFTGEAHLERQLASTGTYQLIVSSSGQGPYTVSLTLR
jgi:hypothetical protein